MALQPRTQHFRRVKAALTEAISAGQFSPGSCLPSMRSMAAFFGVSLFTIQRAVQDLKEEDWLVASPRNGVMVADPLPPIAHLARLKKIRHIQEALPYPRINGLSESGQRGVLKCLLYDEAMLPAFQWAAQEYAHWYAPYSLRFEVQSLAGRDDEESMRSLDADLILLPSYAINWAANLGTITPADGMLEASHGGFPGLAPEMLDLLTWQGRLWAVPLLVSFPALIADTEKCRRFGIPWEQMRSMDGLLAALEEAAPRADADEEAVKLLSLFFMRDLLTARGLDLLDPSQGAEMLEQPEIRSRLERLQRLARHPSVAITRFDQWKSADLTRVAIRQQPTRFFCPDQKAREHARVLPIPCAEEGGLVLSVWAMCVSARSVHPFEAWEWASELAGAPFQARLASAACDVPASMDPLVRQAFGEVVGSENAGTLLDLIRRPSRTYAVSRQNIRPYLWEVFGNELYRFVTGINDYDRLIARVRTKTERFLRRSADEVSEEAVGEAGPLPAVASAE